jgi:alpha-L-fucosidase
MTVSISSPSVKTVTPGSFKRLRPDDQIIVLVGVQNTGGATAGSNSTATVTITDSDGNTVSAARDSEPWPITAGIPAYDNTDPSVSTHEIPEWVSNTPNLFYIPIEPTNGYLQFDDAKFGIFVRCFFWPFSGLY